MGTKQNRIKTFITMDQYCGLRYILSKTPVEKLDWEWLYAFARDVYERVDHPFDQEAPEEPVKPREHAHVIPRTMDGLFELAGPTKAGKPRSSGFNFDADSIQKPKGFDAAIEPCRAGTMRYIQPVFDAFIATAMYTVARAMYLRQYGAEPDPETLFKAIRYEWDTGWNGGVLGRTLATLEGTAGAKLADSVKEIDDIVLWYYTKPHASKDNKPWTYWDFIRDVSGRYGVRFSYTPAKDAPLPHETVSDYI